MQEIGAMPQAPYRERATWLYHGDSAFLPCQVLAGGDGLDEDDTLVIAEVYAGAQITGAAPNHEIL